MNLGIICELTSNKSIGVIAIEKETGTIGYATNDNDLDKVIEILLDNDELDLMIEEQLGQNTIIRKEKVNPKDDYYLLAFNYHLPYPWRILGVRYIEGDIEEIIKESFEYVESK